MLSEHDRDLLIKIREGVEKLAAEVRRLRGDVVRLHSRVEPFENDIVIREAATEFPWHENPTKWKLADALNVIAEARRGVVSAEYSLNAIRGRMDEIASDAMLRDEMKPYIIEAPRRRRPSQGDE